MFDEALSVVAIWSSVISWFTPAVLFVVLNLVIGTIAFTSGTLSSSPSSSNPHAPLPLSRSPSVLHRLRSLHLSRSDHLPPPSDSVVLKPSHSPLPDPDPLHTDRNAAAEERDIVKEEEKEQEDDESEGLDGDGDGPTMEQVFDRIQKGYGRSKSDGGYTMAPKNHRKRIIQKAASDISTATGRFEPPPLEEAEYEAEEDKEGENHVDGKAEDFINRFRQQLNLQRLESLYGATARN